MGIRAAIGIRADPSVDESLRRSKQVGSGDWEAVLFARRAFGCAMRCDALESDATHNGRPIATRNHQGEAVNVGHPYQVLAHALYCPAMNGAKKLERLKVGNNVLARVRVLDVKMALSLLDLLLQCRAFTLLDRQLLASRRLFRFLVGELRLYGIELRPAAVSKRDERWR